VRLESIYLSKHGTGCLAKVAVQDVVGLSALAMKLVVICQVVLAVRISASLLSHQKSVVSLSDDTLQHTTRLSTQSNCKLSEAEASAAIARHTLPHTQHTLTLSARTSCDTAIVDASRYCMQGHEQAGRGSRIAFKQLSSAMLCDGRTSHAYSIFQYPPSLCCESNAVAQ